MFIKICFNKFFTIDFIAFKLFFMKKNKHFFQHAAGKSRIQSVSTKEKSNLQDLNTSKHSVIKE